MMDETVEEFEAVYRQARVEIVGKPGVSTHLPFLFSLQPTDLLPLYLSGTGFQDQTWRAEFSATDLKDEVRIGGSWSEFLLYGKEAPVSDNVKLLLGGSAIAVDGHGASSTMLPLMGVSYD